MKYPLFKVHVDVESALANVKGVLNSSFLNEGKQVKELTEHMQTICSTKNIVLTNSCTSALTLALRLCGVGPGDVVFSTPMTCVATNAPIVTMGGTIKWIDVNKTSGCMDPSDLRSKFESSHSIQNIKAVIVVAWAGTPPELSELHEICDEYGVPLILDAAHAFGATYHDKNIHEFADMTCYSFQAIKHITTGDGGMLICKSCDDHSRAKRLKWFGIDRDDAKDNLGNWKGQRWDIDITEAGYKFAMNNLTAALGLSQLPHVDSIINTHRKNAATYDDLFLIDRERYVLPAMRPLDSESSFWVYTVLVHDTNMINRDELLEDLNNKGVNAGLVHVPNDVYSFAEGFKENLPGVREFADRQFNIPVGWWLNYDDINNIYDILIDSCHRQVQRR